MHSRDSAEEFCRMIPWIGKQVSKFSNKPFKSGEKINTVRGIMNHPILNIPAFVFHEDDSYVECRQCKLVEEQSGESGE